ncbi:MAG: hypothetical protein WEC79_00240 [Thermomicrobiales bacterium]
MTGWKTSHHKLPDDHKWECKPGYNIFVGSEGAIRFDIPEGWIVEPTSDAIKFHDKQPPDDDCLLQVSIIHLPPGIDWSEFPLTRLLDDAVLKDDPRDLTVRGKVKKTQRPDLELVWVEATFVDPNEQREARSRACLARGSDIQALITFEYWPEHRQRFGPVWNEVLRSLRLGEYISGFAGRRLYRG